MISVIRDIRVVRAVTVGMLSSKLTHCDLVNTPGNFLYLKSAQSLTFVFLF